MVGWVDGWMVDDGQRGGQVDKRMREWILWKGRWGMDGWMGRWVGVWVGGWMEEWLDGWEEDRWFVGDWVWDWSICQ